ncbi:arginine--tRNA ligase [Alistipes sp. An31A]|jgi:arginyl-tRNA synthetase|uniref:arginine--tRNA ligase n=1 Tax=unclassified Alistipes TaxID=2608932 RepID=UPI000B398876|nr:arginine--tRNA ligase [Alistipes sp. An31A]OUO19664.1 arginine--tRNA ligase [Alistipes sp. An31A]
MNIENFVTEAARRAAEALYGPLEGEQLQLQKTRREFEGDYTLVTFPLLRRSRKSPEATATELGTYMKEHNPEISSFNVVKGFLNLVLDGSFWADRFDELAAQENYGCQPSTGRTVMIEYSSPNTNKPLHLGHIRNNLLGYSVAQILQANGHRVIKANLVNDRGIHICKSMLAWKLYGDGETPASTGMKGDHLVGKYYVEFDKHYKAQIKELMAEGQSEEEAKKNAPIMREAQEMLRKWEAKDPEVYALWEMMNGWVYEGFDVTYRALGVDFDKVYYESQTYLLGKSLVEEGLRKGVFYRRPDNSVWIDLRADGLDEKLLLRGDGTSVYMTQDLGTAYRRFEDNRLDDMIYVVGNEQNYHFQVLKLVLKKLGYAEWSDHITHLSYGMVELPEGKMKSREGTVVDADDLIADMVHTAREMSAELGKLDGCTEEEANAVSTMVGLGALKYFILKVDPKKTMLFDPRESIDFNGNTGPFIQYTHARICSVLRKAAEAGIDYSEPVRASYLPEERELVKMLTEYPSVVKAAGENFAPSLIAAYVYELAKQFNGYYHDHSILKEEQADVRRMRLRLAQQVARVIRLGMKLLGIDVPERM